MFICVFLQSIYMDSMVSDIPLWKVAANSCREILDILRDDIGSKDLLSLSRSTPNYGLMNALESLIELCCGCPSEVNAILLEQVLSVCAMASTFAAPVVNASSPEGFLPDSDDAVELMKNVNLDGTRPTSESTDAAQLLLVMCWRMTKSVSMLMGTICSVFNAGVEIYKKCGQYFLDQLTHGRHRGAFELAATGFTNLCKDARCHNSSEISNLPEEWLRLTIDILSDEEKCKSLCNTRRSAGLPFLFTALCCSDVGQRGKPLLHQSMGVLFPLAKQVDNPDLSCHARNILRALFRESSLSEDVLRYAEDALMYSISGFADKSWALRNTSAMLYSTLCSRIFGVKKSDHEEKISNSEFFSRFSNLEKFLLDNLETGSSFITKNKLHPTLLPSLLIIQRLYPTGTSNNEARFIDSLFRCAASRGKLNVKGTLFPRAHNLTANSNQCSNYISNVFLIDPHFYLKFN